MDRESSTHSERWDVLGSKLPKSEIVYFCQMIAVYIIIVRSIVNLSLQNGKNEMWITLLSSVIGYALSSPTLKVAKPEEKKKEGADSNHVVSLLTLQQNVPDRSNGKWKDPVRLPIIEDRQGHVRRRPSERDHVLFPHSPTAVRRNGKVIDEFTADRRHRLIVLDDLLH